MIEENKSKLPVVSIVIPTYNRGHLVGRAIQSVLNQTFQDFEIMIVDDGSTDNTEEIVKSFGDSRIHYIRHGQNRGGSAARNTGLRGARGEYVGFLDSDEEWLPEKLGKQMRVFGNVPSKVGVVYTGCLLKKENETDSHYCPFDKIRPKEGDLHDLFLKMNIVRTSAAVVKKECFLKAGMFDESLPRKQERELWIRISKYYHFKYIAEPLLIAYWSKDSISANEDILPRALKLILKKHINEIKCDKKLLARYYYDIGILLYQSGKIRRGRRYLIKAVDTYFLNAKFLFAFILTLFGKNIFDMARKLKQTIRLKKRDTFLNES